MIQIEIDNIGPQGPAGSTNLRVASAPGPVVMVATDDIVEVAQGNVLSSITLPSSPVPGKEYTVVDGLGVAFTYNMTVYGPAGVVATLDQNGMNLSFYWNADFQVWRVLW